MMEFPQMNPIVARAEDEPGFEREIWQPSWNCFCCQDSGIVRPHLVKLVMRDYDWNIHKLPACMNPGCKASSSFGEAIASMLDCRLSATICQQLDQHSREDWTNTVQVKQQTLQQLADSKSLRSRSRTPEEEQIVKDRIRIALEF